MSLCSVRQFATPKAFGLLLALSFLVAIHQLMVHENSSLHLTSIGLPHDEDISLVHGLEEAKAILLRLTDKVQEGASTSRLHELQASFQPVDGQVDMARIAKIVSSIVMSEQQQQQILSALALSPNKPGKPEDDTNDSDIASAVDTHHGTMRSTAHIIVVSGGLAAANETIPMLKSLLLHARTCNLNITLFTGGGSATPIAKFFKVVHSPAVDVNYRLLELDERLVQRRVKDLNLQYAHHSGVWGVAKFFLPDILPDVEAALVIDTDFLFFQDICDLWQWGTDNVVRPRQGTPLMHASTVPRKGRRAWKYDGDYGLCSCISIFNFGLMRKAQWTTALARSAFQQHLATNETTGQFVVDGDQTMNVAIANYCPEEFREIPQSWALNHCQSYFQVRPLPEEPSRGGLFLGALHFNCLKRRPDPLTGYPSPKWRPYIESVFRYRPEWLNAGRTTNTTKRVP